MASTKLTDVAAALSLVYGRRLTTQINSVAVLPFLLPVITGSGKQLNWTAEFSGAANAVASAEGVARDSSDADDEIEVPATLSWAQYDKVASVTGLAQAAAGSNYNPESIGAMGNDLLTGRITRQMRRMGLGIANDSYAGDPGASPTELAGAALAIDSSGTFAGINPGTYAEWAASEDTLALTDISFQNIREKLFTPVYDACGEAPEFCTAPSNVFDKIKELYNDREPSFDRTVRLARGGGARGLDSRVVTLEAGMDAVLVDGIPIIRDRHCTANTIYAWNTNYVSIHQLDPMFSRFQGDQKRILEFFRQLADNPHLQLPREQLEGMAARSQGIRPHVRLLGDRGDSTEAMIICYAQLEWLRRGAFGKLTFT